MLIRTHVVLTVEPMPANPLPSPYDYLDYRDFLRVWFTEKKKQTPSCSHRWFAKRAACSTSLLHHVTHGERDLSDATTDGFIRAMSLRAGEASFFRLLVAFDQAKDADSKQAAWENIRTTRRFREARSLDRGAYDFLANWYVPAIRELATLDGFEADPTWLASALVPPITRAQAASALEILQTLGLLEQVDGGWAVREASVATPMEVRGLAARQYHRGMLTLASDAIERFDRSERHLLGITVTIPNAMMPTLKTETTAMIHRIMDLCDSSEGQKDRVMQVSLQLFPLSRDLGEETS